MTAFIAESAVEEVCLDLFAELGWAVLYGPHIAPDMPGAERSSYREVLLDGRLLSAIERLNPAISPTEVLAALATFRRPESVDLKAENWRAYAMLTRGVPYERRMPDGSIRSSRARLIDFDNPSANDFAVVNQFTVQGDNNTRRPDVIAFVNGIPLGLLELKVPGQERATLKGAFGQLRTYAAQIPALLTFNACCVVSTGTQARIGPLPERFEHFAPWKTIDGTRLAPSGSPEMHVLIPGVFEFGRFLDLVRNFVVFSDEKLGMVKRLAKYHQFHAVNKAVASAIAAMGRRDGRAGVVWHTQGSGKSLEMLFCATKLMSNHAMANPTIVVITDRNDLDDQLFGTF
ncbi:MAG: type I restriction endonuclease, partial [Candidatus Dormibacteraceae bacterium]